MTDFSTGLKRNPANHTPLTPIEFLQRTAAVYPDQLSVIYEDLRQTWSQTFTRCRQLADGLQKLGIGKNDTVAALLPNTPPMMEAHFGIPMAGAVLTTLNTRSDIHVLTFCLQHSEAKALIIDNAFEEHVELIRETFPNLHIIQADDQHCPANEAFGDMTYEELLQTSDDLNNWEMPEDEWDAISLNYTSGTTGTPKGVVYHHRGAALNALSNILDWDMEKHPVYLWTLPMFHCNGWCFPWTVAERAGVNVCMRQMDGNHCLELIAKHGVTHYSAAPIVHNMIAAGDKKLKKEIKHVVKGMVAGAPPPESMLATMEKMNFEITHVYGLTEVYGPASVCVNKPEWEALTIGERAQKKSRQGVASPLQLKFDVFKKGTNEPVASDGEEIGELVFTGNIVMKGYLKNRKATEKAFDGGYFRTGDLGVKYADGYIKIKDRLKDIIISGGENISSIEVENIIYQMDEVLSCAIVAAPDEKWGEVPVAFVEIKPDCHLDKQHVLDHCKAHLAGFKVPKYVLFAEIPKTSTGKVQKFELRSAVKALIHETPKVTKS